MNNIFSTKRWFASLAIILMVSLLSLTSCFKFTESFTDYISIKSIEQVDPENNPTLFKVTAEISNPNKFAFKIKVKQIKLKYKKETAVKNPKFKGWVSIKHVVIPLKVANKEWQEVPKGGRAGKVTFLQRIIAVTKHNRDDYKKSDIELDLVINKKKLKEIDEAGAIDVVKRIAKGESLKMKVHFQFTLWRWTTITHHYTSLPIRFPMKGQIIKK